MVNEFKISTDDADTAEYNAFGPWVDEVATREQVPRLYRDHPLDFTATELVLKVPRDIARREAVPGMNLYDALIVVEADTLTVLERTDATYAIRTVPLRRIVALDDSVALLDGRLTVLSSDADPLEIRYNGSAWETIVRLVDLLRRLAHPESTGSADDRRGAGTERGSEILPTTERDHGVVGDFEALLRSEPEVRLFAAHATTVVPPSHSTSALRRALHSVRPMRLQGAIYCGSASELQILRRREWLVRGGDSNLTRARTIVFWPSIERVDIQPHPVYDTAAVAHLTAGSASLEIVVPTGSAAESLLRQRAR